MDELIRRQTLIGLVVCAVAALAPGVPAVSAQVASPAARDIPNMGSANGVTCRPDGTCIAVGGGVVVFNAAGVLAPLKTVPGAGRFADVVCLRSGSCMTVGENTAGVPVVAELAADGTPGAVRPVPGAYRLYDIACPSATTCIAIGMRRTPIPTDPYAIWTPVFTVITDGQPGPVQRLPRGLHLITAIACPTSTRCLAVDEDGVVVLTRGDTGWTATAKSPFSRDGSARARWAISCPSPSGCYVLGAAGGYHALMALTPDGDLSNPRLLSSRWGMMHGISCLVDGTCTVVGTDYPTGKGVVIQSRPASPPVVTIWENSTSFDDVSCLPTIGCGIVGVRQQQAVFAWTV